MHALDAVERGAFRDCAIKAMVPVVKDESQNSMPRPRSDGPKRILKRRADGTIWAYLYDRRTGENVGIEQVGSLAQSAAPGSMSALILDYRDSPRFKSRKPGTRNIYGHTLDFIDRVMGPLLVKNITPNDIQVGGDELQDTPSKANQTLALLSI